MELDLGLKITHTGDDQPSVTTLRLAKDRGGPVFWSKETETMFLLVGHLKGFRRESIDVRINEDGTLIVISGEKVVQEIVMVQWIASREEAESRRFRKVFRIPAGVILDRIKAKFDEDESILSISMPKSVRGIHGFKIEEIKDEGKEEGEAEKGKSTAEQGEAAHERGFDGDAFQEETRGPEVGKAKEEAEKMQEDEEKPEETKEQEAPVAEETHQIQANDEARQGLEQTKAESTHEETGRSESQINEKIKDVGRGEEKGDDRVKSSPWETEKGTERGAVPETKPESKGSTICFSGPLVVAGSAFLVSLVAIVIQFVRAKRREKS